MKVTNSRHVRGAVLVFTGLVVGLAAPAAAEQANSIAHKVSGSSIKKHSVAGNRLKNNTVTGTQIKESTLRLPKLVWIPLNLGANWASARDNRVASYAVDAQGVVHLKGGITCTTTCTGVAFTLPDFLHPNSQLDLPTYGSGETLGEVFIDLDGKATVYDIVGTGADGFTGLDGVTFTVT